MIDLRIHFSFLVKSFSGCDVHFSHSVVSDSLRPHESQHTRPPCPSPTPRVYSNPCPSSRWCHPTIQSHYFMANSGGGECKQRQTLFSWAPESLWMVTAAMKWKDACFLGKNRYDKPRQCIKKQRHHFADEGLYSQSYNFSSSHLQMWIGP